jgi:hypothetical protein
VEEQEVMAQRLVQGLLAMCRGSMVKTCYSVEAVVSAFSDEGIRLANPAGSEAVDICRVGI